MGLGFVLDITGWNCSDFVGRSRDATPGEPNNPEYFCVSCSYLCIMGPEILPDAFLSFSSSSSLK